MKRWASGLLLLLLSLAVFLAGAETAARLVGFPGRLSGERPGWERRYRELGHLLGEKERPGPYMLIHPFFGYTNVPGSVSVHGRPVNNLGFPSPADFPYRRRSPDEYVILFLGGSVAEILTVESGDCLARLLEADPSMSGKQVRVLTAATGAYKQPQQLLILLFLLARGMEVDGVVNLDGFNEVAISHINRKKGVNPFYPSTFFWDELLAYLSGGTRGLLSNREYLGLIVRRWDALSGEHRALGRLLFSPLGQSGLGSFLLGRLAGAAQARVSAVEDRLGEMGETLASPWERMARKGPGGEAGLEEVVDFWRECSRQLDRICRAAGIVYLHALQPNQYDPAGKKLGAEEKKIAYDHRSSFRPGAEAGYPLLRAGLAGLAEEGVRTLDLSPAFNNITEPVYVDDCAHFNRRGNDLLMEKIAAAILAAAVGGSEGILSPPGDGRGGVKRDPGDCDIPLPPEVDPGHTPDRPESVLLPED